jgi:hypothetical protein
MPENKPPTPASPEKKDAVPEKPKTDEQLAQENMAKFLGAHEFSVTKTGNKVYVNVFDKTRFWWACCKINGMKPKMAWPASVELRYQGS